MSELRVGFRKKYLNVAGLTQAPNIFARHLKISFQNLGKRLITSAVKRMKKDKGQSQQSLRIKVQGKGLNIRLDMYSNLVQAKVDAWGLAPEKAFPDWRAGSRLYNWVKRKVFTSYLPGNVKKSARSKSKKRQALRVQQTETIAKKVAFHIWKNGIVASHWDRKTLEANQGQIRRYIGIGLKNAVKEINRAK